MYLLLAFIFFTTLLLGLVIFVGLIFRRAGWKRIAKGYAVWLFIYGFFIFFGTGTTVERLYVPHTSSPYKLPWEEQVSRFVSQGNASFTSHHGLHRHAWDFWMPIGTKVLASREGVVAKVEQSFSGIGLNSNFVVIEHNDGSQAVYAHIKKNGSAVRVRDRVQQGQLIAYSGMVGQTINPHLHFVVFDSSETRSLPITFSEVPEGVPQAGHFYTSENTGK